MVRPTALRLSFVAGPIVFDSIEAAASALAFVAGVFEADDYFVRTGETWFTAANAVNGETGYTTAHVPGSRCLDCGRVIPPTQFRCDACERAAAERYQRESYEAEAALDDAVYGQELRPVAEAVSAASDGDEAVFEAIAREDALDAALAGDPAPAPRRTWRVYEDGSDDYTGEDDLTERAIENRWAGTDDEGGR